MWTALTDPLSSRTRRYRLRDAAGPLSWGEVLRLWQESPEFAAFFSRTLAGAPFNAFRWETPPLTSACVQEPFEFVLVESPELRVPGDPRAFAEHFRADQDVVSFTNLGGDADLVVPCPRGPAETYAHLAAFLRGAPEGQKQALWSLVGRCAGARLGSVPFWLSTAGAGVAWLHVRLDSRPKYYSHVPYRTAR